MAPDWVRSSSARVSLTSSPGRSNVRARSWPSCPVTPISAHRMRRAAYHGGLAGRGILGGMVPMIRLLFAATLAILCTAAPVRAWDIQWEASEGAASPRVSGYVKNDTLRAAANLHMRVDRLAADGAVIGTSRAIVVGPLHSGDRLYFD